MNESKAAFEQHCAAIDLKIAELQKRVESLRAFSGMECRRLANFGEYEKERDLRNYFYLKISLLEDEIQQLKMEKPPYLILRPNGI